MSLCQCRAESKTTSRASSELQQRPLEFFTLLQKGTKGREMCRAILAIFLVLYGLAVLIFAFGIFGWWGAPTDPVAGVYLVLIGQPCVSFVSALPEASWIPGMLLAPALNLAILKIVCKLLARR